MIAGNRNRFAGRFVDFGSITVTFRGYRNSFRQSLRCDGDIELGRGIGKHQPRAAIERNLSCTPSGQDYAAYIVARIGNIAIEERRIIFVVCDCRSRQLFVVVALYLYGIYYGVAGELQFQPAADISQRERIVAARSNHDVRSDAVTVFGITLCGRDNHGDRIVHQIEFVILVVRIYYYILVDCGCACRAADFHDRASRIAGIAGKLIAFVTGSFVKYGNLVALGPYGFSVVELDTRFVFVADRYLQNIVRRYVFGQYVYILGLVFRAGGEHRRHDCK